uniref:Uncharacterized protein n=1 Tax=Anguilla anguilla TaxID=7936 RepID=A0A0E9XGG0_ANGAN
MSCVVLPKSTCIISECFCEKCFKRMQQGCVELSVIKSFSKKRRRFFSVHFS